jgi:sirohydrochlorin ferrochelatase
MAQANEELFELARAVREKGGWPIVEPAFLEGMSPSIQEGIGSCVEQGAATVVVVPYFLLWGTHVAEDIPMLVEEARAMWPDVRIVLAEHIGDHDLLAEVVRDRVQACESAFDGEGRV